MVQSIDEYGCMEVMYHFLALTFANAIGSANPCLRWSCVLLVVKVVMVFGNEQFIF